MQPQTDVEQGGSSKAESLLGEEQSQDRTEKYLAVKLSFLSEKVIFWEKKKILFQVLSVSPTDPWVKRGN